MKCQICGSEASSGTIIQGEGFCCSKDCEQIAVGRVKASNDELLAEPLEQMPDSLETHDFERWAHKLALHYIRAMTDRDRAKLKKNNPMMLNPTFLSLELKDKIIRHIHKAYVSETETRGHARMFHSGTYCFRQPVPKEVIEKACQKAGILK